MLRLFALVLLASSACATAQPRHTPPGHQTKVCPDGSVVRHNVACPAPPPIEDTTPPTPSDPVVVPPPEPTPVEPEPIPPPPSGHVLAPTLRGEAVIADNFDTALGLEAHDIQAPFYSDPGAFRFLCQPGHLNYTDPIIYPRGVSPHLHQFFGNTGTDANSTSHSLRTTGKTTCGGTPEAPLNRSAYWAPAMFDGAGNVVKPRFINVYYKRWHDSSENCAQNNKDDRPIGICVGMPNGLRFVFGHNMATMRGGPADSNSDDQWYMYFSCDGVPGKFQTIAALVANGGCAVGRDFVAVASAPNCWDGKHLDTPDHRSHMSQGTQNWSNFWRGCPATHPYVIPDVQVAMHYTVDANFKTWAFSSDVQMGAVSGSTFHFDFWEAWSPTVKAEWEKNCIGMQRSCSSGDLGNKTKMRNAGVPFINGKWEFPPSEVVPIPGRP